MESKNKKRKMSGKMKIEDGGKKVVRARDRERRSNMKMERDQS